MARKLIKNINYAGSSIPVGIAIGRQRQQDVSTSDKKRLTSGVVENPEISTDPNFTASAAPPPPPWSITVPPGPHSGPSHYPASNPFGSPWMHPTGLSHPMGPIPMGYQLAKDPLTGQMLLIPTGKNLQTLGGSPWSSG